MKPADVRAVRVVNVRPLETTASHPTYLGTRTDTGTDVFIKDGIKKEVTGRKVVDACLTGAMQACFPNLDRFQNMTETMASHFLRGYFERQQRPYSGITYQEVVWQDGQRAHLGIAAPCIPHLTSLSDVPAGQISNPEEAVEGTLLRGMLLGDFDVAFNSGNTMVVAQDGVMSDGTPVRQGQAMLMDFGEAGGRRVSFLGVPYANQAVLRQFPQHVPQAMGNLLQLNRASLLTLVSAAGQHVSGWNSALTRHFVDVFAHNLERTRQRWQTSPQWFDPNQSRNPFRQDDRPRWSKLCVVVPAGASTYFGVRHSGVLDGIPSTQAVADQVAALLPAWPMVKTGTG